MENLEVLCRCSFYGCSRVKCQLHSLMSHQSIEQVPGCWSFSISVLNLDPPNLGPGCEFLHSPMVRSPNPPAFHGVVRQGVLSRTSMEKIFNSLWNPKGIRTDVLVWGIRTMNLLHPLTLHGTQKGLWDRTHRSLVETIEADASLSQTLEA